MAKRDIDKQIEQIRERLVVLNREAIVCPQPTPAKKRTHSVLTFSNELITYLSIQVGAVSDIVSVFSLLFTETKLSCIQDLIISN